MGESIGPVVLGLNPQNAYKKKKPRCVTLRCITQHSYGEMRRRDRRLSGSSGENTMKTRQDHLKNKVKSEDRYRYCPLTSTLALAHVCLYTCKPPRTRMCTDTDTHTQERNQLQGRPLPLFSPTVPAWRETLLPFFSLPDQWKPEQKIPSIKESR